MYLTDYHTHSRVSPDSRATMVDMVESAMAHGVQEICFTDHFEPHYWDLTPRRADDWEALLAEFSTVSTQYVDKIKVRLGMELGEVTMDLPKVEEMLKTAPPMDFIIGSVHRLSKAYDYVDLHDFKPKSVAEAQAAISDYLNVVQAQCDWGKFTVLGHITLPLRYFCMTMGMDVTYDNHRDQVAQIYKTLIDKGLGMELNTTRGDYNCPQEDLLRLYYDLGGRCITTGSDAHQPHHVAAGLAEGQALLQACGFTYVSSFEHGKELRHKL